MYISIYDSFGNCIVGPKYPNDKFHIKHYDMGAPILYINTARDSIEFVTTFQAIPFQHARLEAYIIIGRIEDPEFSAKKSFLTYIIDFFDRAILEIGSFADSIIFSYSRYISPVDVLGLIKDSVDSDSYQKTLGELLYEQKIVMYTENIGSSIKQISRVYDCLWPVFHLSYSTFIYFHKNAWKCDIMVYSRDEIRDKYGLQNTASKANTYLEYANEFLKIGECSPKQLARLMSKSELFETLSHFELREYPSVDYIKELLYGNVYQLTIEKLNEILPNKDKYDVLVNDMQIDKQLHYLDNIISYLISQKSLPSKVIRFADSLAAVLLKNANKYFMNVYLTNWKSLFSDNIVEYRQYIPHIFAYLVFFSVVKTQDTQLNKLDLFIYVLDDFTIKYNPCKKAFIFKHKIQNIEDELSASELMVFPSFWLNLVNIALENKNDFELIDRKYILRYFVLETSFLRDFENIKSVMGEVFEEKYSTEPMYLKDQYHKTS